jgi:magnesium-protoporphyrin IX monomethyl ester (oxidative) cyclase
VRISDGIDAAKRQGGLIGGLKRMGYSVAAAAIFGRLFCLPAKQNALPQQVRLQPAW